jgi:ribosomal protein S18 acetylase RimI-like enzyme
MTTIRIVDVIDEPSFGLVPPCADPSFDHRTCDYWEDADRGSKASRPGWLTAAAQPAPKRPPANPFAPEAVAFGDAGNADAAATDPAPPANPFAPPDAAAPSFNPFAVDDVDPLADNPFAPSRARRTDTAAAGPRKLALLARGSAVFGSYAKVLLADDEPVAYSQFGPLSAYPRAQRLRDLYPQLPEAPLPAVITCIATTADARRQGHALTLVAAVCDDLAGRGFAAVEAYPERSTRPDATSAATPEFWVAAGFGIAVEDERFPVARRELG